MEELNKWFRFIVATFIFYGISIITLIILITYFCLLNFIGDYNMLKSNILFSNYNVEQFNKSLNVFKKEHHNSFGTNNNIILNEDAYPTFTIDSVEYESNNIFKFIHNLEYFVEETSNDNKDYNFIYDLKKDSKYNYYKNINTSAKILFSFLLIQIIVVYSYSKRMLNTNIDNIIFITIIISIILSILIIYISIPMFLIFLRNNIL